jgi:cytochrome c-type biogenesis protein CcmE
MNRVFFSVIIVFVVVGGLAVYQATKQTSSSVLIPSEVLNEKSPEKLLRIKVGGKVNSVTKYTLEPNIELLFKVQDPGKGPADPAAPTVPVVYNGLKPDMFNEGRDVIIEGEYVNGLLKANKLLTQCPSKYEPPSPDSKYKKESTHE